MRRSPRTLPPKYARQASPRNSSSCRPSPRRAPCSAAPTLQGAQPAARLTEAVRTRAAAEQRAAALAEEVAQMHAQLRAQSTAAGEREAQLQRSLEQQESAAHALRASDLEQHRLELAHSQAQTATALQDLQHERARAASYLESLQSIEGRRRIVEEQLVDLDRETQAHAASLERQARG